MTALPSSSKYVMLYTKKSKLLLCGPSFYFSCLHLQELGERRYRELMAGNYLVMCTPGKDVHKE